MLNKGKAKADQSYFSFVQEAQQEIKSINIQLQRLLDVFLEEYIERETY